MLRLTRKEQERVLIGHDIVVTVVKIRRGQVCLGIEAPRHVPVHREEIYVSLFGPNTVSPEGECDA